MQTMKIGIIGCGNISNAYFSARDRFPILEIAACADLDMDRARAKAAEWNIPVACTVDELLAMDEIEIVVNLTIPHAHAEIALATLEAGKHAYSEKPFAVYRQDGRRVLDLARERGLLVGCAPDTFLGGGNQTARKALDDGIIGEPVAASAHMMCHGHESWHPDPEFYYKPGGGPMLDMGPYYLTALVNLLGPVGRLAGSATVTFPQRTIGSEPKRGTVIDVEVPTHVNGIMQFAGGAIGTITTSFDVWAASHPAIEIYGTEGTMQVPDPNSFGGAVRVRRPSDEGWVELPLSHGYTEQNRGIGVADMAYALRSGRTHRVSGDLAYHVLDVMLSFADSWETGKWLELESTCPRPAMLPVGLEPGQLDD
ncbi:MAG: Gfo/Idh/MocA family oxidoreductase [Armatimonadetes bacterium]|nr:Gfo/Idh/MocA family oxidoreductase [Armatimonadota bacterium]